MLAKGVLFGVKTKMKALFTNAVRYSENRILSIILCLRKYLVIR